MKKKEIVIDVYGAKLDVVYYYTPEEVPVFYTANGDGYPGCPPEVDILSIKGEISSILDQMDSDRPASKVVQEFYDEVETTIIKSEEND